MKIFFLSLIIITTIFSCSPTPEAKVITDKVDVHQSGIIYDSSANLDAIIALNKDLENLDSISYKTKYADTVIFWNNDKQTHLSENVSFIKTCLKNKVQVKVEKNGRWGSRFNHKNGTTDDFVYQSIDIHFTRGSKSVDVEFFQADQFKDGKIVREYNYYDPTNFNTLLK